MRTLRQFVVVADCGSISRAAGRLNMSQPTLSRSIRSLEKARGVRLFDRHGEGVTLTKYGQVLYAHAIGILAEFDRATDEIRQLQGLDKSFLRIAAGDLWGYVHLPSAIREFAQTHPNVVIDMDIIGHSKRLDGLRKGIYDIAFGISDPSSEALYALTFFNLIEQDFSIFGDASHPLLGQSRITDADLAKYRWVNHKFEYGWSDGAMSEDDRDHAIRANTLLNALQMIRGSELLISASSGFEPLFQDLGLATICKDEASQRAASGAIFRGTADDHPLAAEFLEFVKRR